METAYLGSLATSGVESMNPSQFLHRLKFERCKMINFHGSLVLHMIMIKL